MSSSWHTVNVYIYKKLAVYWLKPTKPPKALYKKWLFENLWHFVYGCMYIIAKCRVIHESVRDFWPLRYGSRDGHAEEEHVNRGRDTKKAWRDFLPIDMLFSAVSVLVVAQPSSVVPEGLTNYPVFIFWVFWKVVENGGGSCFYLWSLLIWLYVEVTWSIHRCQSRRKFRKWCF